MDGNYPGPIVSIRVEAPITEELLRPRRYTAEGRTIEVHRAVGNAAAEEARSAAYRYNGVRLDSISREFRTGSNVLTKEHTELVGAMSVLSRAKFEDVELWSLREPQPDLKAKINGRLTYIEVTQVRPNDESAFQREMQAASALCSDFVSKNGIAQELGNKQVRLSFITAPVRRDHSKFAQALVEELSSIDLSILGRKELTSPYLSKFLHSFEIVSEGQPHVKGAGIVNLRGFPDYANTALNKIQEKRGKRYTFEASAPLWLAATMAYGLGPDWLDVLKRADIPLGQFERIFVCSLNDMLIYE